VGEVDPTQPTGIKAAEVAGEAAYKDCMAAGGKTKAECDAASATAYEAELKK
jgi:hypothetical protein